MGKIAVCEFSNYRTITEGSHRLKGGSRENSFNNRGLIMGTTGEGVPPENFRVAEWGDTGQVGRVIITRCGKILDVIEAEGPEAVGADGGVVELLAGMVEVAHADLTEVPRMVVVVEHTVVVHAFGAIAASEVPPILLDAGRHRRCRSLRCPLNSIPSFSPWGWGFDDGAERGGR